MGKPMKNRILGIVLALCLIAVAFAAVPTNAAVYYTGSVQTTDDSGDAKDVYFSGERIYVAVELDYMDDPVVNDIYVAAIDQDGDTLSSFYTVTDDPDVGVYDSWSALPTRWLTANHATFSAGIAVVDVVVSAYNGWTYEEFARTQIIVKQEGLTVYPSSWYIYPGETVTMSLTTSETGDFYVQIVNETYEDLENWTNQEAVDGTWTMAWTVPEDAPDGYYTINVCEESTDAIWYSYGMQIQLYMLMVDCNRYYVLPGEDVTVTYDVINLATMTSYDLVDIEWQAYWVDEGGDDVYDSGTLSGVPGTMEFTIPTDIALWSGVDMAFWANDTDDRSSEDYLWFSISTMSLDIYVDNGPYVPGETVDVEAYVSAAYDALPDATVDIEVSYNGTAIDAYGVTGLVTDQTGNVQHSFDLDVNATQGAYIVTVTATKLDNTLTAMAAFEVMWTGEMTVEFDKDYYYSGQLATFTFTAYWNNEEVIPDSIFYMVYDDYGTIATGNTSVGTGSVQIPAGYIGDLWVEGIANIDGYFLNGYTWTEVRMADVVVTASSSEYRPGDTVTFSVSIITEIESADLTYTIEDDYGAEVASGNPAFGMFASFEYAVPLIGASDSYTATVTMNDNLGHIASDSTTTWLVAYHELTLVLDSSSKYVNDAFKPGDMLTVTYQISTYTGDELPVYELRVYVDYSDTDMRMQVTQTSGEFTVEIPADSIDGAYWMTVYLYDPISGDYLSGDYVSFTVKADQSAWDRSVGGLSLFDLTVLLLLVVMILLLIVLPFVKAKFGGPKAPKQVELVQMPPPPMEEGKVPPSS